MLFPGPADRLSYAVDLHEMALRKLAAAEYLKVSESWPDQVRLLQMAGELAFDRMQSRDWDLVTQASASVAASGKLHAVVIGISEYAEKMKLQFAETDAKAFANFLRRARRSG